MPRVLTRGNELYLVKKNTDRVVSRPSLILTKVLLNRIVPA